LYCLGGTFTYTLGKNAAGESIGEIDTHQLGVGFGGHILFSHTEDSTDPSVINTGTWTPTLPKLQYYKLKIHIPATGASVTDVVYKVYPYGYTLGNPLNRSDPSGLISLGGFLGASVGAIVGWPWNA
jgi:hypothetical protein